MCFSYVSIKKINHWTQKKIIEKKFTKHISTSYTAMLGKLLHAQRVYYTNYSS